MFEDVLVISVVMAFMELVKKYLPSFPKEAYFIPVILMAVAFNAITVYFFGDPTLIKQAVAEGIQLGVLSSGIYGLGKAALGRS